MNEDYARRKCEHCGEGGNTGSGMPQYESKYGGMYHPDCSHAKDTAGYKASMAASEGGGFLGLTTIPWIRCLWDMLVNATGLLVFPASVPARAKEGIPLLRLPAYRQLHSYTCGLSAGLSVVRFFSPEVSPRELAGRFRELDRRGIDERQMVSALGAYADVQSVAKMSLEEVASAIQDRAPVMVKFTNAHGRKHWAVIYGVDDEARSFYATNLAVVSCGPVSESVFSSADCYVVCRAKSPAEVEAVLADGGRTEVPPASTTAQGAGIQCVGRMADVTEDSGSRRGHGARKSQVLRR